MVSIENKNSNKFLENLWLGDFSKQLKDFMSNITDKIKTMFWVEINENEKEKEAWNKKVEKTTKNDLDILKENSIDNYSKLFENNTQKLSIEFMDNEKFIEVKYTDKDSWSKVWWMIPIDRNWDSNIYLPWDRSWINESLKNKNIVWNAVSNLSKKAWFVFEWDSDKIKSWTSQSTRYDNIINNFENITNPMKWKWKITLIWHSRAGSAINQILWKYPNLVNKYYVIDGVYWNYTNLKNNTNWKIYYTKSGGNKIVNNTSAYNNISNDYTNLWHEEIVNKVFENDLSLYA